MLPNTCNKLPFKKLKTQQGFAVLTSAILLSVAGIVFTANMASSQLVDNQIIGNYYRNNEAFANAESGMNFVLSILDDPALAKKLHEDLYNSNNGEVIYPSTANHYSVTVSGSASGVSIESIGKSMDESATRVIALDVETYVNFTIPESPIGVNGKINFYKFNSGNSGCNGLDPQDCLADGNIAETIIESNPGILGKATDECSGMDTSATTYNQNSFDMSGSSDDSDNAVLDNEGIWESSVKPGSTIFGIPVNNSVIETPTSLFEATYGIEFSEENIVKIKEYSAEVGESGVILIDGERCDEELQDVGEQDDVIFITGDCEISNSYAEQSVSSENKILTIGSTKHPKLVFVEGGSFVTAPNTGAKVMGMLHLLPSVLVDTNVDGVDILTDFNGTVIDGLEGVYFNEDEQLVKLVDGVEEFVGIDGDFSRDTVLKSDLVTVNLSGVTVDGALLSEYKCTYSGRTTESQDESSTGQQDTKEHFSANYDKLLLGALYSEMNQDSIGNGYRLISGTWRDF
ncbi:pilus assembly PilX N-terminal domain-containing protein [Psychromonas sp. Urea-02u-13]|uniref:pilus assembly PilX N-terminal domain-containing protein n=1 Tax=Psychromonas sp. Urea-02u-13 TaxID=2058326 RepID=UPI000C334375|nr:pilus assembly PilX N-terminal domain-containing protein [Psychromonas sp. Urea-02u-13]PKG40633.1 hypothetical protein CXF74_02100 [Psychromonas sp. Urea-02u-13]